MQQLSTVRLPIRAKIGGLLRPSIQTARNAFFIRSLSRAGPSASALQAYPLPDVQLLMNDMHDAIKPFYPPSKLKEYNAAVSTLLWPAQSEETTVSQAVQGAIKTLDNRENWSHVWFSDLLLSTRLPLSTIAKVSARIQLPNENWTQADSAARLLRAVAVWHADPAYRTEHGGSALTENQRLVSWQMEGLRGFRYPVKGKDEMIPGGPGTFAVVWHKGRPFRVELRCFAGVLHFEAIKAQINAILAWKPSDKDEGISNFAALSWRLGRDEWGDVLESIKKNPRNEKPLDWIYNSSITLALEDYESPTSLGKFLDDVRLGSKSENRFADQTLGSVIYSDGQMGLTFDHTPSDGAGIVELSRIFGTLLRTQDNYQSVSPSIPPQTPGPIKIRDNKSTIADISLPDVHSEILPRDVTSFRLSASADLHQKCRERRLMDPIMNWTYQAALKEIFGGWIGPVFQPVHQRKYVRGRTNLMQSVSQESLELIRIIGEEEWVSDQDIATTFSSALAKRREQIEIARDGRAQGFFRQACIHPILEQLAAQPSALDPSESQALNVILDFFRQLSPFSPNPENDLSPGLQFSGFTLSDADCDEAIAGVQGNIFLPKQFVLTYLDRPGGRVDITINATGERIPMLKPLELAIQKAFSKFMTASEIYLRLGGTEQAIPKHVVENTEDRPHIIP